MMAAHRLDHVFWLVFNPKTGGQALRWPSAKRNDRTLLCDLYLSRRKAVGQEKQLEKFYWKSN